MAGLGLTLFPPSHLFSERPSASTAIVHSSSPPSLTRIFPCLSPVSTPLSHLYLPPSPTRITPSLALVSTSVWHSYYPSTRYLPEPRRNDCQKREDMTGEWRRMQKGVGILNKRQFNINGSQRGFVSFGFTVASLDGSTVFTVINLDL